MSQENVELVRNLSEHFVATGEPAWDRLHEFEIVMDEALELDKDVLFTVNQQEASPTGSGNVRPHNAYVFICEDSRIVRWTAYQNIDEARAAAERFAQARG